MPLGDIDAGAAVVYGILDSSYEEMLDDEWLGKNFGEISTYFSYVNDSGFGYPIYGYELNLDETSGLLSTVNEEQKNQISQLYSILLQYHEKKRSNKRLPKIGYFTAIDDINGYIEDKYNPQEKNEVSGKNEVSEKFNLPKTIFRLK